jgi:hypothetical protein
MLAADRDIFFLPVEQRLAHHHPDRIELWISRVKPVVATSIQDATQAIKRTFKSVADLFTRTRHRTLLEDEPPDSASGGSHFLASLHRFLSPTTRYPIFGHPHPTNAPATPTIINHFVPNRSMPLSMAPTAQVDSNLRGRGRETAAFKLGIQFFF